MNLEAIRLKVIGPDESVEELTLEWEQSLILGSGASAKVKLDDPSISSIHAMIKAEEGKVKVIDLGSESGTRVAGKEIREHELESGDVIDLGSYKIQVAWASDEAHPDAFMTEVVKRPAEIEEDKDESADSLSSSTSDQMATEVVSVLQEEGEGDIMSPENCSSVRLFCEKIPPEDRPAADNKLLEMVMIWSDTIIGIGHFTSSRKLITVGTDPGNDFNLSSELIGTERFPLVRLKGKDQYITIAEGMDLSVRNGEGDLADFKTLYESGRAYRSDTDFKGYSYKIDLHDQVIVTIGETAIVVRYVRPSKRLVTGAFNQIDYYFTKVFSTSFMAHMLFIAALVMTPLNLERLSDDLFTNPNRFAKLIIEAPQEEERVFDDLSSLDDKMKVEDESKFGEIEEIEEDTAPSDEGAPIVDVDQREEDRKKVMETGLLAALEDGASSNVFGPGGLGVGINEALGGIDGDGMGDAWGLGGLGSRGAGAGRGGGALGIGGLGTKGGGKGKGGHGQVDLGGRGRAATKISSGQTIIEGGLDREVIARIVRRHQNEIRFCYERELQRDPNLHGRIAVQWVIDGTGAVVRATIQDSTMGNSNVENCILVRVQRWRFPEPRGGGIVRVTYPWIFSPRG